MDSNILTSASSNTWKIRDEIGDIKFGFVAQAIFALIMCKLGAKVSKINASGHPDIIFDYLGSTHFCEVEVVGRKRRMYELKSDDAVILVSSRSGYLAILDTHEPVRWHVINISSFVGPELRSYYFSELISREDSDLSEKCNEKYYDLVNMFSERISFLGFEGISRRVIRGEFGLN